MSRLSALLVLAIALLSSPTAAAEPLIAGSDRWAPFFMPDGDRPTGIAVDLMQETQRRTGYEIKIQFLPNKRLRHATQTGLLDIVPLDSPAWNQPEHDTGYEYSEPILQIAEYAFVSGAGGFNPVRVEDLFGRTVGTMAGYHYRSLAQQFDKGLILRADVSTEQNLLNLLVRDRVDAILMDMFMFSYVLRRTETDPELVARAIRLSTVDICIKVRRDHADLLPEINRMVAELKNGRGRDAIIGRYVDLPIAP